MAADLREIIGALRIASDLERVGDLGKNIAKRVAAVSRTTQPQQLFRGLEALAELTLMQLKAVLDLYATRAVDGIAALRNRDARIDAQYTSLFRELVGMMTADPQTIPVATHLHFCAKNIERIGDHATNIAENVYYMTTGELLPTERKKEDQTHKVGA